MIRAILSLLTLIAGIIWNIPAVAIIIIILFIIQAEFLDKTTKA